MLLLVMTTSSQPSSPALSRRSRSEVFRGKSPRSIFRYSHSGIFVQFQTEFGRTRRNAKRRHRKSPIHELILIYVAQSRPARERWILGDCHGGPLWAYSPCTGVRALDPLMLSDGRRLQL